MIIRILGEGQREVADTEIEALNALDEVVEAAVETGDEAAFVVALASLLDAVRTAGQPLADDSLEDSHLILPPSDATLDDVRALLADDGLIPG